MLYADTFNHFLLKYIIQIYNGQNISLFKSIQYLFIIEVNYSVKINDLDGGSKII